jgi:outer membrane protein OmpA-like peptidoglycan-associated protein
MTALKSTGIFAGWIAGILVVGGLVLGFTQNIRDQSLKNSVNTVLAELRDPRQLDQVIPDNELPKNMSNLGTWFTRAGSDNRLLVFSIMNEGIPVPCLAELTTDGTVSELIPLNGHSRQVLKNLPKGTLNVYLNRIEATAVLERARDVVIEYREPVIEKPVVQPVNRQQQAADIVVELERLGIADTQVTIVDEGITLNLDNIQFASGSALMLPGEERKLDQISTILLQYRNQNILIAGHTAQAGSTAGDQELSEARAQVVADHFITNNVRDTSQIEVRGYGSSRPVAENNTEAGRQKNRRVEIVLR